MTRLLLDTHLLLWWLKGDPRLPQPLVERVTAPEAEVFVSQVSLWEMAIKLSIGRLQVDLPELEQQVPLQGFRWLPIRDPCRVHEPDPGAARPPGESGRDRGNDVPPRPAAGVGTAAQPPGVLLN